MLQNALELPGCGEALGTAHNVVLLAACTRAAGHAAWLADIRPRGQVFVTHTEADSVLFGASIADGGQVKLGAAPGNGLVRNGIVRYVGLDHAAVGFGGHSYFARNRMPKSMRTLFARIFGSARDFGPGESARRVYPAGCDADGTSCYMAAPDRSDLG